MQIKPWISFAFVFFVVGACSARDYSGKTFFRSQSVSSMAMGSFFDSSPEKHAIKNYLFRDVRFEIEGIYRCSRSEAKLGSYFGVSPDKNTVSIGALVNDYDIFNQKIIYYDTQSGYQAPLVRGTFELRPREIIRGFRASVRKWLGTFYCDCAVTCAQAEHSWQLDSKDAVIDPVTGLSAPSFLQGGVKTANQNPLLYATIKDIIPSNGYEVLNVVVTSGADGNIGNGGRIGFFGECILPAATQKYHDELFAPTVGSVGHMGMGLGVRGMVPFVRGKKYTFGCFTVARATKFFQHLEKRLTGVRFATSVGDAVSPWGHYVLSKNTTASVYDPAINLVGPQSLIVKPGPEFSLQLGAFLEGCYGMASVGYKAWFRGDEDLAVQDSAVAATRYNRVLATGDYGLAPDLDSCRAPAVVTHSFSGECSLYISEYSGTVRAGANYEVAVGNAALNNVMISLGLTLAF